MSGSLKNRTALVTGGAGPIGFAIASALREAGARVHLADRDEQSTREAVERLGGGTHIQPAVADLRDNAALRRMFEHVVGASDRLDILVNNAAHLGVGYSFLDTPDDLLADVLATNLRATFVLSQLAARRMVEQRAGAIVHLGSTSASRAIRNRSAYIASKGGVESLTRAMAVELAPHGVRVNLVAPGYVRTPRWDELDATARDRRRSNIPSGREATPADVAATVRWLCDPANTVTGQRLAVDGAAEAQAYPADTEA